jgi:hypothetical protein
MGCSMYVFDFLDVMGLMRRGRRSRLGFQDYLPSHRGAIEG